MLQKWMARYQPGYKVRVGVREGYFLQEKTKHNFWRIPVRNFFPKMAGGMGKISTWAPTSYLWRSSSCLAEVTDCRECTREVDCPEAVTVSWSLTGTDFSKRFLLETDNSDSSSDFSKKVIFKSTWEVPSSTPQAGRLREGSRPCSHLPGHTGIPEGWTPHRSGRKLLPPPGHGKSDETGTICQIFQERSAQESEQHKGQCPTWCWLCYEFRSHCGLVYF